MKRRIERCIFLIKDFFIRPSSEELKRRKEKSDYDYLRSRGVETCPGWVNLVGLPCIEKAEGARIIIGKGVTLISDTRFNTAGINHPVVISAEGVGSVIEIQDNVGISGASIVTCSKIVIGAQTMIGANCNIYGTDFHCLRSDDRLNQNLGTMSAPTEPIIIGERCWLASNVTVLKGVTIGNEAVVGAMSLVTSDVPEKSLFAGNPAKKIKDIV